MAWWRREDSGSAEARADAGPRVLRVDGGRYAAIGAALRDARDGDVIEIAAGTYAERLVVDKAVELRPAEGGGPVALQHDDGPLVLRADATVRDLMITAGGSGPEDALVIAGPGVAPTVVGCMIGAGDGVAIRVRDGAAPVVRDCRTEGSRSALVVDGAAGRYERCLLADSSDDAVAVRGGATPELVGCTVLRPGGSGFWVSGIGAILTLHECLVDRTDGKGLWVVEAGRAVLSGTTLRYTHGEAVSVSGRGAGVELTGCTITGGAADGVTIHDHAAATVTDCTFTGARRGVTAIGRYATATITGGAIENARSGAVSCSGTATVTITGVAVRYGNAPITVQGTGTLVADDVTIEDAGEGAFLVAGGESRFTRCRVVRSGGPGFAVLDGRAVLDSCEVSDGRATGFDIEDGSAVLTGCVAHHNADSGFVLNGDATLTACASYANGEPDEVGIQEGAPVPAEAEDAEPPV